MKKVSSLAIIAFLLLGFLDKNFDFIPAVESDSVLEDQVLSNVFKNKQSDVQVEGAGIVVHLLPDDTRGSQHQKFIVKLSSGQTVLISHNIDLAPRINLLVKGDEVRFYGEYEWNAKGGVVHWTHHAPRGKNVDGWLKHKGVTYQ